MKLKSYLCTFAIAICTTVTLPTGASANEQVRPTSLQPVPDRTSINGQVNFVSLSGELCGMLNNIGSTINFPVSESFEGILFKYSEIQSSTPDYRKKLALFWNEVSPRLICRAVNGDYDEEHFFKRTISMNIQQIVLNDYFFEDENLFPIDANVVEVHSDGSATTLLDYVDLILSDNDLLINYRASQLRGLRRVLVQYYGAKKHEELKSNFASQ